MPIKYCFFLFLLLHNVYCMYNIEKGTGSPPYAQEGIHSRKRKHNIECFTEKLSEWQLVAHQFLNFSVEFDEKRRRRKGWTKKVVYQLI